jgi:hypothetical protein
MKFTSHAPTLAENVPSPWMLAETEYQSRNNVPMRARTVPTTTIHWLRDTFDQSISTLLVAK